MIHRDGQADTELAQARDVGQAEGEKDAQHASAAPVTTRAVRASPTCTAAAASPLRSHSSRTRPTMNTW